MQTGQHPYNTLDKPHLRAKLERDKKPRVTFSFYKYQHIDPLTEDYRAELFQAWEAFGMLGRIYIAGEGINAQVSLPEEQMQTFMEDLERRFPGTPLKIAVEVTQAPFYKLIVKIRHKILADGLNDRTFDVTDVGRHLNAREFNEAMSQDQTIVVDMRNYYESEIGHFKGALRPDCDTFREELPMVLASLEGKEDNKILLYCTGGIRCEKASAYLKHKGFKDVNQLKGGIIQYAHEVKEQNLECQFIGKNFVFDDRLGERISEDVIAHCHQCGSPCDSHTNCRNDACHLLFIQCSSCQEKWQGCCGEKCQEIIQLPIEQQKEIRRSSWQPGIYKSRLRPKIKIAHQQKEA